MASNIDPSKPAEGETPAVSANMRANFLAAKNEIEALQELSIDPSDVGYDIWLLWGQSNFSRPVGVDSYAEFADPVWSQYGNLSNDSATYQKIVSGGDPLKGYDVDATTSSSCASWFSRAIARMTPSNRTVLVVQTSVSGTAIVANTGSGSWAPGNPGGNLYEMAIAAANSAIAAAQLIHPASRFVGFAAIQGESDGDAAVSKATYKAAYLSLMSGFRSRITGGTNALCIIGGMVPEAITNRAGYSAIAAAHQEIGLENDYCIYVPGISGVTSDNLHYNSSLGHRRMGAKMARYVPLAKANVGLAGVSGASDITLADATTTATATVGLSITGSASITLSDATTTASASNGDGITGSAAITLADATTAATAAIGSASLYDFESDTVGQAPADVTQQFGTWVVANSGGSPLTGKYLNQTNSGVSFAAVTLDNLSPSATNQTLTWRRAQSTGVRDLFVLRPQSSTPNGSFPNTKNGYWFHIVGDGNEMRILSATNSAVTNLRVTAVTLSGVTYFRASCIGSTIDFEYSSDGVTYTSIGAVTDTTHSTTSGAVQYSIGYSGGSMTGVYLDNIQLT